MSQNLYVFTICLPFATILLVFGMRAISAAVQARAQLAHDDAYRRIAQQTASAQTEMAAALSSIQTAMADVRQRIGAIETVLKDVG